MNSKDKADKIVGGIENMGSKAIAVQADTSNFADIKQLFEQAKNTFGKIDIVVATAGNRVGRLARVRI